MSKSYQLILNKYKIQLGVTLATFVVNNISQTFESLKGAYSFKNLALPPPVDFCYSPKARRMSQQEKEGIQGNLVTTQQSADNLYPAPDTAVEAYP